MENKAKGCLVGLAVGDAVGTTLEFTQPGTFTPIKDMVGGGPFNLEKGQWTDDTSMALCLGNSLLHRKGFNAEDQMNRYWNWYQYGYLSSTGTCFDIGLTVSNALNRYQQTRDPFSGSRDPKCAGNGALMRLAPIPIFYSSSPDKAIYYAVESSRTTHGATECLETSRLFCQQILMAFSGRSKEDIIHPDFVTDSRNVDYLARAGYLTKNYSELTGGGYVIESLESALWCFYHSTSFKDAVLLATNIGNDADTTAAICGQIAGAYYGFTNIPPEWSGAITKAKEIEKLAGSLYRKGLNTATCVNKEHQQVV